MVLDMKVRNWCELSSFKTYCKQRQFNGENTVFSTNGAGTLDIYMQNTKTKI